MRSFYETNIIVCLCFSVQTASLKLQLNDSRVHESTDPIKRKEMDSQINKKDKIFFLQVQEVRKKKKS